MSKRLLLFLLLIPCVGIGLKAGNDLTVYYRVARYVVEGRMAQIYPDSSLLGNFFYGPLSFVILGPLGFLPFEAVHWLWLAAEVFCYVIFWRGLSKAVPGFNQCPWYLWVLVWLFSIKPIHASFQSYNIQLMIAAALVWAQSTKREFWAGFVVSLLAGIKVYPALMVLYYLFRRSRPRTLGLLAGGAGVLILPTLVFGVSTSWLLHSQFLGHLGTYTDTYSLTKEAVNLSLPSLIATWGENWLSPQVLAWVIRGLSGVILAGFFFTPLIRRPESWALAMAVMALLNVSSRPDYFVLYVPAFATLAVYGFWMVAASSFALMALISQWTLGAWNHPLESLRVPVVGACLLCAAFLKIQGRRDSFR